jgi:non-ribosomal peptide synthetase component F
MGRLYFGINEGTATRLAAIAQARRVSVFVIYLAALHLLLARWCGTKHAITAVNTADRVKPQFLNTVGYLITSLPIASEIDENSELGTFLSVMARNFYDAYGHRDLSYDLYDVVCQPPGPFCTTLFNFIPLQEKLSAAKSQAAAPPPTGILHGPPVPRVKVHREIYFCLVEMPRGMVGKVYYNLDFFNRETFEDLIARFGRILEKMSEGSETKLAEIP